MATDIQFLQSDDGWEYSFTSSGPVIVQVEAVSAGRILVYGAINGLSRALVGVINNPYGNSIFSIDLPNGVEVCIWSSSEATQAKMEDAKS